MHAPTPNGAAPVSNLPSRLAITDRLQPCASRVGYQLDGAVRQRQRNRRDFDLDDAGLAAEADLLGGGGGEVHDSAANVRTAVANRDQGAFARFEIGNPRGGAEGQGLLAALLPCGCIGVPSAIFLPANICA